MSNHREQRTAIDRRGLLRAGTALGLGAAAAAIGGTGGARAAASLPTRFDAADVADVVKDWPDASKAAADEIVRKYGPPQEATATMLLWRENGPWKRTVVHKNGVEHDFPTPHQDVLEQVVAYKVPLNFFNALATFDGSVVADRTRGELTARCDREATNMLVLNLAHDIVRGYKTADQARDVAADAMRQMQAGKTPDYAQKLLLGPPQGDLSDPDTAAVMPAASGSSNSR
jgi:hypothetical protein